jgi:DNA anti-recombination protein RmuC
MSQTPITVTYSLEEILTRLEDRMITRFSEIEQKFDRRLDEVEQKFDKRLDEMEQKFDKRIDGVEQKFDKRLDEIDKKLDILQNDGVDLKVGQAKIEEKVEGLAKRIDNQEFVSRGILVGLIIAILGGTAKLFGFIGNL